MPPSAWLLIAPSPVQPWYGHRRQRSPTRSAADPFKHGLMTASCFSDRAHRSSHTLPGDSDPEADRYHSASPPKPERAPSQQLDSRTQTTDFSFAFRAALTHHHYNNIKQDPVSPCGQLYKDSSVDMCRASLAALFMCVCLLDRSLSNSSLQDSMRELHTRFSINLYHTITASENTSNLIVSPVSLSLSLGLLQLGAKGNTLSQLEETLGYNVRDSHVQDFLLHSQSSLNSTSQSMWLQQTCVLFIQSTVKLLTDFIQRAVSWANTSVVRANFSQPTARQGHDEQWPLAGSSSGELSGSGDPQTDALWWSQHVQMALVNTVAFRGAWQKQFLFTNTQNLPFVLSDGTAIKVPMMYQATEVGFGQFRTGSDQRYTVLELPYLDRSLSLQVVLPSDRKTPLSSLEAQLTPRQLMSWDMGLRRTKMDIFIPRFKMQNRFNLKSVMPAMGISDAFNPATADFTRITVEEALYVSDAFHDVRIEVTEDGTKAAAATAMVLLKRSRAPVFKADRPFLFLLRQIKTGSILFMGRVMNPVDQSS